MAGNTLPSEVTWTRPPLGWWKINWDFAIDKAQCRTGMGMLVRDHTGTIIAAKCLSRAGNLDPTAGEALASLHAIRWCQELGRQAIILEGDAKQVVDAINSDVNNGSRLGHIVEDIRQFLKTFLRWHCAFVNRNANTAAHRLAKGATKLVMDREWKGETQDYICDIIEIEKITLSHD